MKKLLSALALILVVLLVLVACDGGSTATPAKETPAATEGGETKEAVNEDVTPAPPSDLVVYGIYKAGDQAWFIDEGAAAQKAVEAAGGTFIYVDAKMDAEEYLRAIDNAIANNASGVVTCPVDQQMSQAVIDKLESVSIPVVAADDALEVGGKKLAPWVGLDAYVIGEGNGEWLAEYVKENKQIEGEVNGFLLMTMDTVSSVVPRSEGTYNKFTELIPEYDTSKIYKADYNGETDKAFDAAQAIITAHPEVENWIVSAPNDEGAVGVVRALEQVGLDENSTVIGIGAYLAKDEFKKDYSAFKAAAYSAPDEVGRVSVEVLLEMINGTDPAAETKVPAIVVTPENYEAIMGEAAK